MANEHHNSCQAFFRNLLKIRVGPQNHSACLFIRELMHTVQCDHIHDLSKVRTAYYEALDHERMQRIISYDESAKDERIAKQAVCHYYDWTHRNLMSALAWPHLFWYHK